MYALDWCPTDPATLAVAVGDQTIRVWNTGVHAPVNPLSAKEHLERFQQDLPEYSSRQGQNCLACCLSDRRKNRIASRLVPHRPSDARGRGGGPDHPRLEYLPPPPATTVCACTPLPFAVSVSLPLTPFSPTTQPHRVSHMCTPLWRHNLY